MDKMRLAFRRGDLIAIGAVILLAVAVAAMFLPQSGSDTAGMVQIYRQGQLVKEMPLGQDTVFQIAGDYMNTVEVRDGSVAITASDCPGSDCVHSGWIHSRGRSIVCLPNQVEVRIVGASDVDMVVG